MHSAMRICLLALLALDGARGADAPGAEAVPGSSGPPADLLAIGERLYREGTRPNGEPLVALINGDVPARGTEFTCVSCHQRSGLGSNEGWLVAPPVTGRILYRADDRRPAYTDDSLARAVREATDPAGRRFGSAMPGYELQDAEVEALIAYLKTLSAEVSPGVTGEEIHFATVVTDDVDASPMLGVLNQYFEDKNAETRLQPEQRDRGPWFRENKNAAYRRWVLHVWELHGAPSDWREQLDAQYRNQPVFALISGVSWGAWRPVHEFCEQNRVPCVLPNVDVPVIDGDDYYTLYFSQGLVVEARVVAERLSRDSSVDSVLQVFRTGWNSASAAAALRVELAGHERIRSSELQLAEDGPFDRSRLERKLAKDPAAAVVLWLGRDDLDGATWLAGLEGSPALYLSSTLLGGEIAAVPEHLRDTAHLAHPFTLPDEYSRRFRRTETWLRQRGVEITNRRIATQTYFACQVLREGLMHVRFANYYRDFLLERIDHITSKIIPYSTQYPAPSFGPGQRYLSKGCYIVGPPAAGDDPAKRVEWIVPR